MAWDSLASKISKSNKWKSLHCPLFFSFALCLPGLYLYSKFEVTIEKYCEIQESQVGRGGRVSVDAFSTTVVPLYTTTNRLWDFPDLWFRTAGYGGTVTRSVDRTAKKWSKNSSGFKLKFPKISPYFKRFFDVATSSAKFFEIAIYCERNFHFQNFFDCNLSGNTGRTITNVCLCQRGRPRSAASLRKPDWSKFLTFEPIGRRKNCIKLVYNKMLAEKLA